MSTKNKNRELNKKELLDEHHFLSYCNHSNDNRVGLYGKIRKKMEPDFLEAMEKDGFIKPMLRSLEVMKENDKEKKKKIRDDLTYLRSNKISLLKSSVYTPEAFLEEENKLNAQLSELQGQEQTSAEAMHETVKEVIKLSELIKNVVPYYRFANPREKERIIRIIFSEPYVSQNTLDYKVKKGFEPFKSKSIAFCELSRI